MASLSSRVIWPSTWRTRTATGAAECTHGQPAVAVAPPALAAVPAAVITEQASASAKATQARPRRVRYVSGIMVPPAPAGPPMTRITPCSHCAPEHGFRQYLTYARSTDL